jgi:ABC-type Fe3+/spermidine/putrescine transport system ATPase subunit
MSDRIAVFNDGASSSWPIPRRSLREARQQLRRQFIGENNTLEATVEERPGRHRTVRFGTARPPRRWP